MEFNYKKYFYLRAKGLNDTEIGLIMQRDKNTIGRRKNKLRDMNDEEFRKLYNDVMKY